ncbi:hypothetical protein [Desulfolutivibrio sp.]|uniref:hypothetical protein n=1 Tax=Desulfolutivibrio sp. TaxID=2773296 RepID=UPI002F96E403
MRTYLRNVALGIPLGGGAELADHQTVDIPGTADDLADHRAGLSLFSQGEQLFHHLFARGVVARHKHPISRRRPQLGAKGPTALIQENGYRDGRRLDPFPGKSNATVHNAHDSQNNRTKNSNHGDTS